MSVLQVLDASKHVEQAFQVNICFYSNQPVQPNQLVPPNSRISWSHRGAVC
jgi:hypothetical protein